MYDWVAKKEFTVEEVPEDVARKREKIEKRAEKAASGETAKAPAKPNKSAAAKKLKKQREGLDLADSFVHDIFANGIGSVNKAAATQYAALAKQLGDYYLPEPQAIMNEIIRTVTYLSAHPDDEETNKIIALCVRLGSTIKKSRAYIDAKLESGEVLPEDNILYEEMGGVWKLAQLKELGLYRENTDLLQLSFTRIDEASRQTFIDEGYWIDMATGDIFRTDNIRPYKAQKYIQTEDAKFELYNINELYLYPGSMNRRVRWENSISRPADENDYRKVISLAEPTISAAVKKAKNELKNTLSNPYAAVLIKFDSIGYADDGHGVMKCGEETIALCEYYEYPNTCKTLKTIAGIIDSGGAVFGGLLYDAGKHTFSLCPFSVVTENDIIRL